MPTWKEEHGLSAYLEKTGQTPEPQQMANTSPEQGLRDWQNLTLEQKNQQAARQVERDLDDLTQRQRFLYINEQAGINATGVMNAQIQPGRGFWENPLRIARYHQAAKAAPPGWQAPDWMNVDALSKAYSYFEQLNKGKPWFEWDYPAIDDPIVEHLRSMPMPDAFFVKPDERGLLGQGQTAPVEYQPDPTVNQDLVFGVPRETWDRLPGWQKALIPALPWVGRGMGVISGGLMGTSMGGPVGGVAGAVAGGSLAYGAEKNKTLADAMMKLDVPAEYMERTIGTLSQILDSAFQPEKYGPLKEVLSNLPAAWEAAHLTQDVSFSQLTSQQVTGWELGSPEPLQWTPPDGAAASSYALTQARRQIMAGASPEKVWEEWGARFGFAGVTRDMIGHMLLDPLNKLGEATNFTGAKVAKAAGNAPLEAAFKTTNEPLYALRAYGNDLRQMPQAEAAQFGSVSKWLAGLDSEGNLKDFSTKPQRKGAAGVLDYMAGLTPAARATEVLHYSVDGLNVLVSELGGDDPVKMVRLVKAVAGVNPQEAVSILDGNPLPRWFQSAEAQAVPLAIRDQMPRLDALLDQWQITRPNATILQRFAEISGQDLNKFIADLHHAKPGDAATMYRQLVDSLKARADGGDAGAQKMFKTLTEDRSLSALDGQKLKQMADGFFGPDGAPFHPADFKARLMVALAEGMDGWAAKWFDVKPNKGIVRIANVVKKAQGLALLGLNPTYLINNALNNIATLAWDGLLGASTHRGRMKLLRDMGIAPTRLRSGLGAAEMGEILDAGLAAEAQRLGIKDFQLGAHIREAGRAGDLIQVMDDFAKKGDKLAVFAQLSQKVERWSSEMAMVNAMREFWDRRWKAGDGFSRMDGETRMALNAVQDGLAEKIERAVARGKSKAQIEKEIFSDLGRKSLRDVLNDKELGLLDHFVPDISLSLEADLRKAKTDEDIRGAFRNARQEIISALNRDVVWKMRDWAQETATKANLEKTQGVLDSLDQIMGSRHDFWLKHFEKMDRVAEEATKYSGGARRAIWDNAVREADAAWNAFENMEGAKWLGLFQGLGAAEGSEDYVYVMARLTQMHDNWSQFYTARRQLMNEFFDQAELLEKGDRSKLWAETNRKLNGEYVQALLEEDHLQHMLDIAFADQYARQIYGSDTAIDDASNWRLGIRMVRRKMAAAEAMYRNGSLPEELAKAWGADILPADVVNRIQKITSGIPPYLMPVQDRDAAAKKFYQVYTGFIREMLDTSNRNAPGGQPSSGPVEIKRPPTPEQPTEPSASMPVMITQDMRRRLTALGYTETQIRDLNPAQAWEILNKTPQPAGAGAPSSVPASQEVLRLAREFGVPTATDAGGPNDRYLINILRQAGYMVDDLNQATPDMAENAFRIWASSRAKSSPEQIALDRAMIAERARQIDGNIDRMQLEAPKRYTREATAREIYDHFADDPNKADAVIAVMDQIAETWARENGKTRDDWYETFVLERGGVEAGEGLRQLAPVNRSMTRTEIDDYARVLLRLGEEEVRRAVRYEPDQRSKIGLLDAVHRIDSKLAEKLAMEPGVLKQSAGSAPPKGLTRWLDSGQAVIHAFESADVSTLVHEVAHVWLPMLGEKDLGLVERWLRDEYKLDLPEGWQHGTGSVEAKEKFARAFERYLAEGNVSNPKLIEIFERFKNWMMDIYRAITGSDIDIKLNDDIRTVFDKWMGDGEAKPVDVVAPKLKSGRDITEEEYLHLIRVAQDWQYLVYHNGGMARKSDLEDYLTERFGIDRDLGHTIGNRLEQTFNPSTFDVDRPKPRIEDYPDIPGRYGTKFPETPTISTQKSGQTMMFGAGEDLPLFSGTPARAPAETFNPPEVNRQETLWDMRPQMKGSEVEAPPVHLIQVQPDDVNYDTALRAYTGTSWSPEKRAASIQQDYAQHILAVEERMRPLADTPEKQALLVERLERYRKGYLDHLNRWLQSRHGLVSTNIAGPSNFPAARMNKKSERSHVLLGELLEWSGKEQRSLRNALDPRGISSSRADAPELIQNKIDELETLQQRMVEGNKIVRKKDLTDEQKIEQLIALGWKEKTARSALEKDFAGRIGFPDYLLKNNNAEVHRLKGRLVEIGRLRETTDIEWDIPGGRAEINTEINRVQLFFDEKPDAAMRDKLKQRGFKWAPSQNAWQRQWTDNARSAMDALFSRKKIEEIAPEIEDLSPVVEPKIASLMDEAPDDGGYTPPESVWGQAPDKPQAEPPSHFQWKYEDYSNWSREMAKNYTRAELEKRLAKVDGQRGSLAASHLRAVEKTTSMTGNSQRRAQSRNAMVGNYEEYQAVKNALELYDFYPEKTKEGRSGGALFQMPAMPPGQTFAFGTDPNRRYEFRWRVVDLADLVTSHTDDLTVNAAFPKELQPRQRDRAASQMQIQRIASELEPEAILQDTNQLDRGPMIVGPDMVVESGNGRAMALRMAERDYPDQWQAYQQALRERLEEYGLSEAALEGIEKPVLVRERATDVDRAKFAAEANESGILRMNALETALQDAGLVNDAALANLAIHEGWTIEKALANRDNADFVRSFMAALPENERATLMNERGDLSASGLMRIKNALFAHVYPGEAGQRLAKVFIESTDVQVKNLQNALYSSLPVVGRAEAMIRKGQRADNLSIVIDVSKAVDVYARLKDTGMPVSDYLGQMTFFEPELDAFQQSLLRYIDDNARSSTRIRGLLEVYADRVMEQPHPDQGSLFGDAPATKGELLDGAAQELGQDARFAAAEEAAPLETPRPELAGADAGGRSGEPGIEESYGSGALPGEPRTAEPTATVNPAPAVGAPLGTADSLHEPPLVDAMLEGYLKDIDPLLARAEAGLTGSGSFEPGGVYDLGQLDPGTMRGLKKYIGQVSSEMADVKLGAIRWGETRRDAALLNYSRRYGFDNVLGSAMPYEFWYTRSMLQWALRALGRPAILANYARIRNFAQEQVERPGFPSRLKKKMGFYLPFMPDWMGEGIYADPMRQIFPFEQLARPFEQWGDQKTQEQRRAEAVLDDMLTEEAITQEEYDQATQTRSGPAWNRALAQARNEIEAEITNPMDFAFTMIGPSLPISIGYNLLMGRKDRIAQLPATRFIQATTGALGIGGPRGVNIEGPLRKATGLPEIDRFDDYRIDRMLANLAAEGMISPDEAKRAMIDRAGEAFELAQQRVSRMRTWQYFGAPLGVDFFPEGEQEQRQIKTEYDRAIKAWKAGDDNALRSFFDEYPEYETRMASFQEPEERLKKFLISEVWERYTDMTDLHKKQAREQLGDVFQEAFLDKETRSYDSIDADTLALWSQMLGGRNPGKAPKAPQLSLKLAPDEIANAVQAFNDERATKFPEIFSLQETLYSLPPEQQDAFRAQNPQLDQYYRWRNQYLAAHPQIIEWTQSEESELYGLDTKLQQLVYQFRAEREERWPNLDRLQEAYFSLASTAEKKAYRLSHPELPEYWEWRKRYAATYPKIAAYILSEDSLAEMILGEDRGGYGYGGGGGSAQPKQERDFLTQREIDQFSPPLLRQLYGYFQGGQELTEGANNELNRLWETFGKPGGEFGTWLDQYVSKSFRN